MRCGDIDLRCTLCRLSKGRTRVVPGEGACGSRIVFVGEAPGKDEDLKGRPFVGRAGKILDGVLREAGTDRSKVYITNLVKCRPPGNRRPRKDEIRTCSVYLESELRKIRPKVICALGQTSATTLLKTRKSMAQLIPGEWTASLAGRDFRVFVAYHPAACLYQRKNLPALRRQIKRALNASGRGPRQR
jgi:DNA polymerase